MQLYYKPGACSLASHIVLEELGQPFDIERVDTAAGTTETGADFTAINPKGYVPALQLDDGQVLSEGAAILQFLADRRPDAGLAPAAGTLARARLQEHLNYVASELHKAFGPFFAAGSTEAEKADAETSVAAKLDRVEAVLADGRSYLLGDAFSVADAYLFVVASWARPSGIDLERWPKLRAYVTRVARRDAVRRAVRSEGLLG